MKKKQPSDSLSRIRDSLKILRLKEISRVLDDELAQSVQESSPPTDLLERLFTLEANALIQRRIERRIKESKLPDRKLLSDFDFIFQKGVDKSRIMQLAKLDFVDRKQGVIIAGNSGTGNYAKFLLM